MGEDEKGENMKTCKCEHWAVCPVCKPEWFDRWGNRLPPEPTPLQKANGRIEELEQQLATKDAEIERLKTVPMKYRRMAFNAQLQDENAQLCQQLAEAQTQSARRLEGLCKCGIEKDKLREQVTLLREALGCVVRHGELSDSDCDKYQLYCEVPRAAIKAGRKTLAAMTPEEKNQ